MRLMLPVGDIRHRWHTDSSRGFCQICRETWQVDDTYPDMARLHFQVAGHGVGFLELPWSFCRGA